MVTKISQSGINDLKQEEGFSSVVYTLNGVDHIGYGFNLNYHSLPSTMTREQADAYLLQILPQYEYHVRNVNTSLTQKQYDVLTGYVYNRGHIPNALQTLLTERRFAEAADWIEQDYAARGLSARGIRQAKLFRSGGFNWLLWSAVAVVGFGIVYGMRRYGKSKKSA